MESIRGAPPKDYRHLSVSSAVSICLDRVMGPW
nr:RNA methyltransferase [uncultured Bdellovibrio sp.]